MVYEIIKGTTCADCVYRLSRILEPFDLSDFDLDTKKFIEENTDAILLEQHICTLVNSDIDGKVLDCNQHKKRHSNTSLLRTDIFNH